MFLNSIFCSKSRISAMFLWGVMFVLGMSPDFIGTGNVIADSAVTPSPTVVTQIRRPSLNGKTTGTASLRQQSVAIEGAAASASSSFGVMKDGPFFIDCTAYDTTDGKLGTECHLEMTCSSSAQFAATGSQTYSIDIPWDTTTEVELLAIQPSSAVDVDDVTIDYSAYGTGGDWSDTDVISYTSVALDGSTESTDVPVGDDGKYTASFTAKTIPADCESLVGGYIYWYCEGGNPEDLYWSPDFTTDLVPGQYSAYAVNGYDYANLNTFNVAVVEVKGIALKDDEGESINVIGFGQTGIANAITVIPSDRTINWNLIDIEAETAGDPLPTFETSSGSVTDTGEFDITVKDDSSAGYAWITVVDDVTGCGWKKKIKIGCDSCSSGTCTSFGEEEAAIGSVHLKFSLGAAHGGGSIGDIELNSGTASPSLTQPGSVEPADGPYDSNDPQSSEQSSFQNGATEYLVTTNGKPRQIKVPDGLVDIVVNNQFKYDLVFYPSSAIGAKDANGFYTVTGDPNVSYTIENPDASTNLYNRLRITKSTSTDSTVTEYVENQVNGTNEWTMSTGNGLRVEKVSRFTSGSYSNILRTVMDSAGNVVSKELSIYASFGWGWDLVNQVVDPDGAALTTTRSFYTDSAQIGRYSKVAMIVNPDGSWQKYDYDTSGLKISDVYGFQDAGTNSAASEATATYYDYTLHPGETAGYRPFSARTVTRTVLGITNSITYSAFTTNATGGRVEISERAFDATSSYGSINNFRSVRTYYATNSSLGHADKVKTVEQSNGRLDTYTYESGLYTTNADPALCSFTVGTNDCLRTTVTHGTTANPDGIAGKTTRDVSVEDSMGANVLSETYIYTGSGYERISWTVQYLDEGRRPVAVYNSDGTYSESIWGCCGKEWEKDSTGVEHDYAYDALNRNDISTKQADTPIIRISAFDAVGRTLTNTISAGGLILRTSSAYDVAGRQTSSVDAAGLVTRNQYSGDGRTVTTISPASGTSMNVSYLDGRTKYTMQNGAIKSWYDYGVNSDGTSWTKTYTGPLGTNSPVWQKSTSDFLGRTIRAEQPGFGGAVITSQSFYNGIGQLVKSVATGQMPVLYQYDELGAQIRSGQDMNNNGVLDLAGPDRISESESYIEKDVSDNYWQIAISKLYAKDNSAVITTNSIQKSQLTGLGVSVPGGTLASATVSIDLLGNQAVSSSAIDRASKTVTQTVTYPDSINTAISVSVNGLQTYSISKTGVRTDFAYDALGRQTAVSSPQGSAFTHYNTLGQVDYREDGDSNRTTYSYDAATGRRISVTDPLSRTIYSEYNQDGQVTNTYGATYPVSYLYDNYGRMSEMSTWRTAGTADVTKWKYDLATGLLTNKVYADGKGPIYSYTADGKLATRTWARGIVTIYSYDPTSGSMTNISYSDSITPSVSFTLDRLGRQTTVTDGQGTRFFTYNDQLQLVSETNTQALITRNYDSLGRSSGFALFVGGSPSTATEYGYDNLGRFATVSNGTSTATYTYGPDGANWTNLNFGSALNTQKTFDNLNRITSISSQPSASSAVAFTYSLNAINQRLTNSLADGSKWIYQYDNLGQVTSGKKYFSDGQPVEGAQFEYAFDTIGNRTLSKSGGTASTPSTYAANSLNQYSQRTVSGEVLVTGSAVTDATVMVRLNTNSLAQAASRHGENFWKLFAVTNSSGLYFTSNLEVRAVMAQGTNSLMSYESRTAMLPQTPEQFSYDLDGNLTHDGLWANTWNAENRLIVRETLPEVPASMKKRLEFKYDYIGRRTEKKSLSGYNGSTYLVTNTSTFIYDGWNLVAETTDSSVNYYTWGLDLSGSLQGAGGVGGLVFMSLNSTSCSPMFDGNGNLMGLVNLADGTVVAEYEYDPFGNITASSGTMADSNPFRFSTKYFDDETGLSYYGYRYYDPELGRWLNRDPIEEDGGINVYGFVGNDGVNWVDADGLTAWFFEGFPKSMTRNSKTAYYKRVMKWKEAVRKKRAEVAEYIFDKEPCWFEWHIYNPITKKFDGEEIEKFEFIMRLKYEEIEYENPPFKSSASDKAYITPKINESHSYTTHTHAYLAHGHKSGVVNYHNKPEKRADVVSQFSSVQNLIFAACGKDTQDFVGAGGSGIKQLGGCGGGECSWYQIYFEVDTRPRP